MKQAADQHRWRDTVGELHGGFYAVPGARAHFRVFAFLSASFHAEGMADDLGKRIKRLREQRRWTQQQLADLLTVTTKTVGNWENGRHIPRSAIGALEAVFKESLDAEAGGPDAVEAAVRSSRLTEDRQYVVLGVYKRELRQQDEEAERGRTA